VPLVVVTTESGGGEWVAADALADCAPDGVDLDAVAAATAELMFLLSGSQYGTATTVVRPFQVVEGCGCGGEMVTFPWSSMARHVCGCASASFVPLTRPVVSVDEVLLDGETLLEGTDYRLVDAGFLVRVGGVWPCCQDMTKPSTEDGTWRVTFTHGTPVTPAGQLAAAALGCEIAKAVGGSSDCALAGRVQSVTRDGVSAVVVADPNFLSQGRTGVSVTDLWLGTVAPNGTSRGGSLTMARSMRGLLVE
jgi:hypothetical protein